MSSLYKEYMDKLYNLEYMETQDIGDFEVTRVPGGWIFKSQTKHFHHANPIGGSESTIFIPYKRVDT